MCDTFIIKRNDNRFFLKNSDRSPNEPNLLEYVPRLKHTEKEVKCTYISIPQVEETYECLFVKPSWMYGAEMGINEFNLAIGNEAVFTKRKNKKKTLIGMDYLRLALERCKTAKEAKDFIINLLKEYGQGGNCGYDHKFYYNNSYLIADKDETYILETVNKDYAVLKVDESYNISNRLSISNNFTESSKPYKNFKKKNSDFFFTTFSASKTREEDGKNLISQATSLEDMFNVLSHHHAKDADKKGSVASICMHKNAVGDHATGSMITNLKDENPTIWLTGGMSPCVAIYKPYYLGIKDSFVKNNDVDRYNYFLDRTILNRLVLSETINKKEYLEKKEELQAFLLTKERELREKNASKEEFYKLSRRADILENKIIESYRDKIEDAKRDPSIIKGMWASLTEKLSKNPFSNKLEERLI